MTLFSPLVEHWFATCTIIATAGFWSCMVVILTHRSKDL